MTTSKLVGLFLFCENVAFAVWLTQRPLWRRKKFLSVFCFGYWFVSATAKVRIAFILNLRVFCSFAFIFLAQQPFFFASAQSRGFRFDWQRNYDLLRNWKQKAFRQKAKEISAIIKRRRGWKNVWILLHAMPCRERLGSERKHFATLVDYLLSFRISPTIWRWLFTSGSQPIRLYFSFNCGSIVFIAKSQNTTQLNITDKQKPKQIDEDNSNHKIQNCIDYENNSHN